MCQYQAIMGDVETILHHLRIHPEITLLTNPKFQRFDPAETYVVRCDKVRITFSPGRN